MITDIIYGTVLIVLAGYIAYLKRQVDFINDYLEDQDYEIHFHMDQPDENTVDVMKEATKELEQEKQYEKATKRRRKD